MPVSLLPTEGDDGCRPETEAWPPHRLQSTLQQVSPLHMDVGFYISIHVLLSEQAQDGNQVECDLPITEINQRVVKQSWNFLS